MRARLETEQWPVTRKSGGFSFSAISSRGKINPGIDLSGDTLLDDCLVDSLELVKLIMALEDELRIEISDRKLSGKVRAIRDLARALRDANKSHE